MKRPYSKRLDWKRKSYCSWYSFLYCGMRMMSCGMKYFLVRNDLEMPCMNMMIWPKVTIPLKMKIYRMRMA
jgi:hypothetical protein